MIRKILKEIKERKEQEQKRIHEIDSQYSEQINKLRQKVFNILEDERLYDITYVIYSSEFPTIEPSGIEVFVSWTCDKGDFSYNKHIYSDDVVFYINVKKREEPKYNVGDVVHLEEQTYNKACDVMILGRVYDGKGHYKYLVPSAYEIGINGPARLHWQYLYKTEKVEKPLEKL